MQRNNIVSIINIISIFFVRMLGLFIMLPILSPYLHQMQNDQHFSLYLIGLTVGCYGLTQAIFQIPFGILSDYFGRKSVIILGLVFFGVGSVIAGFFDNIWGILLGRSLQGVGAISGPLIALLSDLSTEQQRPKYMAFLGISIGVSFIISFIIGPYLSTVFSISKIFYFIAISSGFMIMSLFYMQKDNEIVISNKYIKLDKQLLKQFFKNKDLNLMYGSIFALHAILTINFIVIPIKFSLLDISANIQVYYYSKVFLLSCVFLILVFSFKRIKALNLTTKKIILLSWAFVLLSELILFFALNSNDAGTLELLLSGLIIFFSGFNILEAFFPSIASSVCDVNLRGSTMGIYSSFQFLGPFVGGIASGILMSKIGLSAALISGILLSIFCLLLSFSLSSNLLEKKSEIKTDKADDLIVDERLI